MKVLLVNTIDKGGAANSCKRLHLGLLRYGINSKILLKEKQNTWPESFEFQAFEKQPNKKKKATYKAFNILKEIRFYLSPSTKKTQQEFLKTRLAGLEMFSFPKSEIDITKSELYIEADIINLHWVAQFFDFKSFFKKNKKPVVWTLHDMNPITGGEHYEEQFLGITDSGFPVKRKQTKEELFVSKKNVEYKKKAISLVENLTLVAPSKWLAEEARKSEVFKGIPVHHIPYGLDQDVFYPRDKISSRNKLKIPVEKKVILFVSDSLKNNRKGLNYLIRAFDQLNRKDVVLCAVGSNLNEHNNPILLELGSIKEEEEMSGAYSAADVFVIPSLMDNLPNTVLESLMCGTPVIGFPVGGIPEMIQEGVNGMLTKEISVSSLFQTISIFLDSGEKFDRTRIRKEAVKKYGLQVQANNYIRLFQAIMKKKS